MSQLEAAVEAFLEHLACELAERVDGHLERVLAQRERLDSALDLAEVARRLGTSERDVRRMVADGRLASVKLGRRRRVPASAVAALLDCNQTPAGMGIKAGVSSIQPARRGARRGS
jgi:excisionase family DNA binding protein